MSTPRPAMSAVKLALLAQQLRSSRADLQALHSEPLAVVGMGCRFPGGANDPERYWALLEQGVDAIREVPAERWDWHAFLDPDPAAPGKITTRWGGFIDSVDGFDAEFFGISPREALHMDPQQRLFLEVAWEALEDAGLTRAQLAGSRTGVFVASYHSDYAGMIYGSRRSIGAHTVTGASHSVLANRLSYWLDLRGPSVSVDTACSSSLVAVHLACESLRRGECDTAIAAGVSLMLTPELSIALSKWGFLAEDGRCKTFDAAANGFVRGEGCGVVVLRRLSDALTDGVTPHALVRGSAVNQDGRTNVLTAPSGLAQQAVVREALANAGLNADDLSYIEAHGTGTALGDPIELEALAEVIGPRPPGRQVVIGSAKTNIGHLEAAAGLAGIIKVILAMRAGRFAPHLHFKTPNPHFDLARSPLRVATTQEPWVTAGAPRRAGVSSFGFGGTNAHVVLEEAPRLPAAAPGEDEDSFAPPHLLPLAAASAPALRALASAHARRLRQADAPSLPSLCFSAGVLRDPFSHRLAAVAATPQAMAEALEAAAQGRSAAGLQQGVVAPSHRGGAVFVFSGQGPQWWAMGRELLQRETIFAEALEQVDAAMAAQAPWRLLDELRADEPRSRLAQTEYAQPALFALQVGLLALWRHWGVQPAAVVGHSVGEIAAAYAAGALDLASAARLAVVRGRIMQAATGLGQMAAIDIDAGEAQRLTDDSRGTLSLAAINAPRSVVLAGDGAALQALLSTLAARGVGHKMLPVNYAFHSAQMEPLRPALEQALAGLKPGPSRVPFYSTVTGQQLDTRGLDAAYWGRNLRGTVRFAPAIAALGAAGHDLFLELGPHPVLGMNIAASLEDQPAVRVLASLRRGRGERESMLEALAGLYVAGAEVDWQAMQPPAERVALPHYPWQRSRYWVQLEAAAPAPPDEADSLSVHPLLGRAIESPAFGGTLYEQSLGEDSLGWLPDHAIQSAIIVPATAYVEMALTCAARTQPQAPAWGLQDLVLQQPLSLEDGARRVQFVPGADAEAEFRIFSRSAEAHGAAEWTCHASGRLWPSAPAPSSTEPAPAQRLQDRNLTAAAPTELYARWARTRGLAFGDTFQGLAEVHFGSAEALARIEAPAILSADEIGRYVVHPALLDACLQPLNELLAGDGQHLWLPFRLEALSWARRGALPGWSHVRLHPPTAADADERRADIDVYDPQQVLLGTLRGLRLRRLAAATFGSARPRLWQEQWQPAPLPPAAAAVQGRWLVCGDAQASAAEVTQRLRSLGAEVTVGDAATAAALLAGPTGPTGGAGWAGILHCSGIELHSSPQDPMQHLQAGSASLLALLQALLRSSAASTLLLLLTRGARAVRLGEPVDAAQAAMWGLLRSAQTEHPELRARALDLDPAPTEGWLAPLDEECGAVPHAETEAAWRGGQRFVARIAPAPAPAAAPASPWRLEPDRHGAVDGLALQPMARREPAAGEVEIEVLAAGLNFRDVLSALAMVPGVGGPLGGECAGRVSRVGPGVKHLAVGDRVMAFARGSFASHAYAPVRHVAALPRGLSTAEAAATPIAFLTAMYALERLARLQRGERVLIHAATGGVGMAALQVARFLGAEIYATAGSPAKRAHLAALGVAHVYDSRSLDFSAQLQRDTGGAGVHVVLNALAGDFIGASVATLAPGGRFLEMGKRDIWSAEQMHAVRADVAYHPFDLGDASEADVSLVPALYTDLLARLTAGTLQPLPVAAVPAQEAPQAFRQMSQARHMGKLVLTMPRAAPTIRPDASYLITGAFGALGLRVARWLAERGARHLWLLGRSGGEQAGSELQTLRDAGVQVQRLRCDVADAVALKAALDGAARDAPPLGGVVHAAAVLDDGVLLDQQWPRLQRVLAPKLQGALNLHRLTHDLDLDFLVFFSAGAAWLGSPGQAGYCAANAALDGLAQARAASGLPATAIAWGTWGEAGMAAQLAARDAARWRERGVVPLATDEALALLQAVLARPALPPAPQAALAAMAIDAARVAAQTALPPRLAALGESARRTRAATASTAASGGAATGPLSLSAQLQAAPPTERRRLLGAHLLHQSRQTLALDESTPIDERRPLKELGLDSLMAVELRNALAAALGKPLPATLMFDFPTLESLREHLLTKVLGLAPAATAATSTSAAAPANANAGASAVAQLSDDEAEALLLAELNAASPGTP